MIALLGLFYDYRRGLHVPSNSTQSLPPHVLAAFPVALAEVLSRVAAELALFAGAGFLLFAANDLVVDLIYFGRRIWRSLAIYSRYPRAFASELPPSETPGFIAILVPAWDEASVIAQMLKATLNRIEHSNYRLFVGYYRNDPATAAAIASAGVVQLRVLPLIDPSSRWISGHYCDEFAEAHIKELVVREAVRAAIPLAGVGCAIARTPLARLAAMQEGKPFAGT